MRRFRPWLPSKCRGQSPSHQQQDLVARQSSGRFKHPAACQIWQVTSCFGGEKDFLPAVYAPQTADRCGTSGRFFFLTKAMPSREKPTHTQH